MDALEGQLLLSPPLSLIQSEYVSGSKMSEQISALCKEVERCVGVCGPLDPLTLIGFMSGDGDGGGWLV